MTAARRYRRPDLAVAVILLVLAVALTVTAYGYGQASGVFPRFIGLIFTALTLAEVAIQIRALLAQGGAPAAADAALPSPGQAVRECKGVLWLCAFLAAVYLLGFSIAIALYMFVFLRLSAGRTVRECLLISGGAVLFVYLVFVRLLEYKLYGGILFGY